MSEKKFYADNIGWEVERKNLRIVAQIAYNAIIEKAEKMLAAGEGEIAMPLLAGTSGRNGQGEIAGVGMREFLEAFFAAKSDFEKTSDKKIIWYFVPKTNAEGKEKAVKGDDTSELAQYAHEVTIALVDDDADFLAIGFEKPSKAHLKRPSGAQEAKKRKAKAEQTQSEKEAEEAQKALRAEEAKTNLVKDISRLASSYGRFEAEKLKAFEKAIGELLQNVVK